MHDQCPDYYRITETLDVNHWAAACLRTANWAQHADAILLSILWGQILRYVIRLPFKGISEPEMVRDIDKAITQLQDLRAALVPPPEVVEAPKLYPQKSATVSWNNLTPHQQAHLRKYRIGAEPWYFWQMPDGDSDVFSVSDSDTWTLVHKHNGTALLIEIPGEGA